MPNPEGRMGEGFADPNGTYRGDLINKQDPAAPIHPDVKNPEHREFPHYNIKLPDGNKAAIIIVGDKNPAPSPASPGNTGRTK
ncbi:MAG: hypothetical protein ACYC8T_24540 [Myxococcaceae bacterium]